MPTKQRVQEFVSYVEQGKFLEAMEEFYADEIEMQENLKPPTVGKKANLERERAFVAWIAELRESRADTVLVDGDQVVIRWQSEYIGTDGSHLRYDQLTHQQWRGDKIVRERFVYDPATLPVAA